MLDLRGAYALLLFKNENVRRMLENGSPRVSMAESKTIQYETEAVRGQKICRLQGSSVVAATMCESRIIESSLCRGQNRRWMLS